MGQEAGQVVAQSMQPIAARLAIISFFLGLSKPMKRRDKKPAFIVDAGPKKIIFAQPIGFSRKLPVYYIIRSEQLLLR